VAGKVLGLLGPVTLVLGTLGVFQGCGGGAAAVMEVKVEGEASS
jgi:hypothetical protein